MHHAGAFTMLGHARLTAIDKDNAGLILESRGVGLCCAANGTMTACW